jgi:hypothetical protein
MELLPEVMGPECPPPPDLVASVMSKELFQKFAEDVAPLRRRRELPPTAPPQLRQHPMAWTAAGEHHVVRRYFLGAMASRGARRLAREDAATFAVGPTSEERLSRARFLVRHPVDVFASYRRRFTADARGSAWADIDLPSFCRLWEMNFKHGQSPRRSGVGRG